MADASGSNSSSDFVRKLYKMLEDPSYESVVRWGNEGDSFVVLENEKFTKSILPKHFKHSNFASFVRQLNKYDFHKVRHNNEEGGQSQYGAGAWEFKHPDFKANNKDALDNIRRKAPVPRKANQGSDEPAPTPQMDMVNGQLIATQQQLEALQQRYNELSMHHSMILQELIGLQKTVVNHDHVIQNVMSYLHTIDNQRRRESKVVNPFAPQQQQTQIEQNNGQQHMQPEDEPASPLAHADKLLSELNADAVLNVKNLEQMNEVSLRMNHTISTPPPNSLRPGSRGPLSVTPSSATMRYNELENVVYPVGQNNGIDPMYSEHIHNIPYPLPTKQEAAPEPVMAPGLQPRKKNNLDPGWLKQPHILLVEDDPTCRRIGGKFLYAFSCTVDYAMDGLEAVNKMNSSKYDLVLMDIIMPNLDGVSATHLIRQFDSTPIIAMTSNIRSDDISMYFQHGMNDVLPKPFTKEGLLSMLEKHLSHLKKSGHPGSGLEPPPQVPTASSMGGGAPLSHQTTQGSSHRPSLKDETSPGASPATVSTTWNSPMQPQGMSPVTSNTMPPDSYSNNVQQYPYGSMDGGMPVHGQGQQQFVAPMNPMNAAPRGVQQQQQQQGLPQRRGIDQISGGSMMNGDVKRQQMYAPVPPMGLQQQQQQQRQ